LAHDTGPISFVLGALAGLLFSALYNLIARWVGGIQVTLQ
jgi:hypothetical protein